MLNRITGLLGKERTSMEENINLDELFETLKNADGYMLSVSIVNGTRLDHSLILKDFDKINMLPANKEIKALIVKQLEEETI